jgi:hypothetical protein
MVYDTIGSIYIKDGTTTTLDDGTVIDNTTVIADANGTPYYHVNMIDVPEELQEYVVTPSTPNRVFAGTSTKFLKFKDRDEWLSFGIEKEENIDG